MTDENINEIQNVPSISDEEQDIVQSISSVQTRDDFKYLVDQFNLNQGKKNALRISKLNKLLDTIEDQAIKRLTEDPGKLSNSDLLDYLKAVQEAIDRSNKYVNEVEARPSIQVNQQNNININTDAGLNRESREKVLDVIKAILTETDIIENEDTIIESTDEGEESDNN